MSGAPNDVERHYASEALVDRLLAALQSAGVDVARLTAADLAPLDAFHIRGREATIELARRAALRSGLRVLDVGCGIGGSARFLASEFGCRVTGIDLTQAYVDAAAALTDRVGLGADATFCRASALDLPFAAGSFDAAWTEHVQMNVAAKDRFYAEIARVLVPGGRLLFHDIFAAAGGPPHFPVPWACDASISFLAAPEGVRALLGDLGFAVVEWEETTARALAWFEARAAKVAREGPPALGTHLLIGPTAGVKFANLERSLRERRVAVIQAVLTKQ